MVAGHGKRAEQPTGPCRILLRELLGTVNKTCSGWDVKNEIRGFDIIKKSILKENVERAAHVLLFSSTRRQENKIHLERKCFVKPELETLKFLEPRSGGTCEMPPLPSPLPVANNQEHLWSSKGRRVC